MSTLTPVDSTEAPAGNAQADEQTDVVEQDVLVEDVSIDGMCGVY